MAEIAKPRLLVMTLIFPPDGVSTAQLLGEIVEDLSSGGTDVQVITTTPHYNVDETAQREQPIRWRWHRLWGASKFGDVGVSHIRMPQKAAGKSARIVQWLWFHLASLILAWSRRKTFDVIFTVSPPPSVAAVASMVRRFTGAPVIYAVWELYPEILVKLGQIEEGSRVHRVLQRLEVYTYKASDKILVLQDAMGEAIAANHPPSASKVAVVPTFADTDFLRPLDSRTSFRMEYGLEGAFVVGYAGNLGVSQDLTTVIEAAAKLNDEGIWFFICGDGTERSRLEELRDRLGASNVIFTGHLPYERVPEIVATCDVSLVVLASGVGSEALPSKAYRIMACGRPILAVCDPGSPLDRLVTDREIGYSVETSSPDALCVAIRTAAANPEEVAAAGQRARGHAETEFSRTAVTSRYEEMIRTSAPQLGSGT